MNANQETVRAEILTAIDTASGVAAVLAPQAMAWIVLGQAVAKAAPGLYDAVDALLKNAEPTQDDIDKLSADIAALGKPETL